MTEKMYTVDVAVRKDSPSYKELSQIEEVRESVAVLEKDGNEITTFDIHIRNIPGNAVETIVKNYFETDDIEHLLIREYVPGEENLFLDEDEE